MKTRLLPTLLLSGLCVAPSMASAATPYVSGNIGIGYANNSDYTPIGGRTVSGGVTYKAGVPFSGAIGLRQDNLRMELALGYQTNSVDQIGLNGGALAAANSSDKVSIFSYMANAYYDYKLHDSSITPYVMAGLGGANVNPQGVDFANMSPHAVFAWQLGAGVGIKASDNVVVDVGYRYFKPSKYTDNAGDSLTLASSNVMLGLRYNF
jgi:opacity protein-like surface antigen